MPYAIPRLQASVSGFTPGLWHHVFFSFNCTTDGLVDANNQPKTITVRAYLDGQSAGGGPTQVVLTNTATLTNPINRPGVLADGYPVYLPCHPGHTALNNNTSESPMSINYADVQVWFTGEVKAEEAFGLGGDFVYGSTPNPNQPTTLTTADGSTKTLTGPQITTIQQFTQSFITAGEDPVYGLSVAYIESDLGTDPNMNVTGPAYGIFQLEPAEIAAALGIDISQVVITDNNQNTLAYIALSKTDFTEAVLTNIGADNIGVYRYLMHNQGTRGGPLMFSAAFTTPTMTLSDFSTINSITLTHLTGTRWAKQAGLTGSNTVEEWMGALQDMYGIAMNDARNRLTGPHLTNMNAFIDQHGNPVDVVTSAMLFTAPDFLFSDNAAVFPINQGKNSGTWTLTNGPLVNAPTLPKAGQP